MRSPTTAICLTCITAALLFTPACSDEDAADQLGIGAQCAANADCASDDDVSLSCLTSFKGGYCGVQDCTSDADCPGSSACVTHDDGKNYCFRLCADKAECNANRDAANESNCSSSVTFVEGKTSAKACVPPSGT